MSQVFASEKIDELVRLAESGDTRGLVDLVVRMHAAQHFHNAPRSASVVFDFGGDYSPEMLCVQLKPA